MLLTTVSAWKGMASKCLASLGGNGFGVRQLSGEGSWQSLGSGFNNSAGEGFFVNQCLQYLKNKMA